MVDTATPENWLALDNQLCFPLYAASHLMARLYRPWLAQLELTYPQYLVMLVLWEQPTLSVGEIGQRLHLDTGTLTPLLKRLASAGLLERVRSSTDERRVNISLTATGQALRARAEPIPQALACQLGMPLETFLQLRHQLQDLVGQLQQLESTLSSHLS